MPHCTSPIRQVGLADFAVGALTDVVAKAEGLDRALLRDFIAIGSPREGTEVPVALRFRGRGAVAGRVVSSDGVTPVSRVAVNLFPDPASRELGRGLFSDGDGRFAFFGVPLGIFSIQADSGAGLSRTVAGVIEQPGQTTNVLIVLSSAQVARTDLTGRVTESDNATPHAGAPAFVGKIDGQGKFCCVVSAPTADSDGYWRASGIPADTYVLMAVSRDGRRKGERRNISAPSGVTNFASISLQGFGVVIGRVETATGIPVVNAIVAGGEQLVRTTNNGTFRLTGVPTGLRSISAGVERTTTNGPPKSTPAFSFPRLGSAGLNVLPGVENFVVVRLDAKGSLIGRVVDETGTNAVTGINVALPEEGGFQWVPVNSRGEFAFEGIALKKYTVSAPAPPVFKTDVSGLLDVIGGGGSSDEIQAAIGEAFAIFTGAADPLLNGEGAAFNPGRWGYTEVDLIGDGEVKNVTVQFFRSSTIAGKVINGQGVPIGARVRLTGIGAGLNGAPITVIRGERNSDPALGTFEFVRQSFIGSYGLQTASPFFPIVIVRNGFTTEIQPDDTNVVLQFPSARDVNGRLAGRVFNPDGSAAGSNVNVKISFGNDYVIRTRADGTFDTQIGLPALQLDGTRGKGYFVEAEDLETGARGAASVTVMPGNTNVAENFVNVRLLGRGALRVTVLQNDGTPAAGARLGYDQGSYPSERLPLNSGPVTDGNGQALFLNLFEGYYGVCARFVSGPAALNGRVGAGVTAGQTNNVTIRLGPTGTIEGTFVKRDGVTPVTFAQVAVGNIGFATTDTNGFFRVSDVPIGTYRLTSSDPVSGIGATLTTVLSFNGQTNVVRLIEQSRGEIRGAVIASDGTTLAPGVNVTLTVSDGITPSRTVTTGPDGRFSFPGAAAGAFELFADHPVTRLTGANRAVLPENAAFFEINVALQPLAAVTVVVFRPDGVTPATNTAVVLGELAADTDNAGRVRFSDLRLGAYTVTATSRTLSETRSVGRTNVALLAPGQAPDVAVRLAGVGRVGGQVFLSNGTTPAAGAVVTLSHLGEFQRYTFTTTTDGNGQFNISNAAVGPYEVSARFGTLGARVAGAIAFDGEADTVSLTVEPSAAIRGRLVRADGVTPVINEDVNLTLPGRNLPGSLFRTGTNGLFEFTSLPLGLFRLQSTALRFNGIALREATLATNGQTNDVGNLVMDEDDPRVVAAFPPDTVIGVPITTTVELVFNETLRSNTVDTTGVYLQGPGSTVAASVQLRNDSNGVARLVRLTPAAPLKSLTTYRVVVVDDVRQDAFGGVIGRGPQDLVGRPLVAPFLSTFTTADNDPPLLLSIFPTNGQIQIDPRAVLRLSFNEPIRETNFSITLTGTNSLVPGAASVGLNGLVLAFAPLAPLAPNTPYTLAVSNIFDLAGNRATNEPFVATFATLDTLGPDIAALTIVSNRPPVAGSTVQVEALLTVNESGVSVRFTQDLNGAGSDTNAPFHVSVTLPTSGSTTVRAIATDRFGNDGPFAELVINTVPNQPPAVSLTRVQPATGPVFRGEPFTVRVSATDEASVTNVALTATGALNLVTNLTGVSSADVTLFVPFNAPTGSVINLRAQAADFAGLLSVEVSLNLVVSNLNHRPVTLAGASGAGNALRFDGVNDFVSVATSPSVNPTTAITIEAWVFAENLNAGQIGIAGTWDDNNGGFRTYLLWILGGRLEFIIMPSFARPSDPNSFPINRWVHVAATYDGTVARLYRDGTNVASVAATGSIPSNGRPFFIGRTEGGSDGPEFFPGSIDEVRLWNRALSPTEIADQHSRALRGDESGLAGYWPFNETTGTTTSDLTANNNVGTLGGGNAANQPARVASTAPVSGVAISTNTSLASLPLVLDGSDPDGDPITAMVTTLPAHGTLFQTTDGITPGTAITNVPATVSSAGRIVLFRRQPGFTGRDQFSYRINDGLTNSNDGLVQLDLVTPPGLDTDGDGMPDGYEFANGLNPEANDASLDADSDGLNNFAEFQAGTDPRNPDTDGDGLLDGEDPNPLVPLNNCTPLPASAIAWWRAESNALDGISGHHGTFANSNFTAGTVGEGFRFTGSNFVAIPDVAPLDLTNALTIELWVSPTIAGQAGGSTFFVGKGNMTFVGTQSYGIIFLADRRVHISLGNGSVIDRLASANPLPLNSYSHVAVTYDGSEMRVYVNGVLENSRATSIRTLLNTSQGLVIGGADFSGGKILSRAAMDEIAIYSRALSAPEIQAIFKAGSAGKCPPVCVPLPANAVAWWRAESNALDAVSTNNGTLNNGAGFAPGLAGQAFAFNGTSSFFSVPDSPALRPASLTLEGWFRFNTVSSLVVLMSKPLGPGTRNSFALYLQDTGLRGTAGDGFTELISTFSPVAGQWHHLAYTFDDAADTHVLYADGVMVASGANTRVLDYDNHPVLIGAESNNETLLFFFDGQADEPAIYSRALSAAEIQAIFNAESAGKCVPQCSPAPSGLVGWWRGQNDALDQVSTNHGILRNTPGFTNGLVGRAFSLSGQSQFIEIPSTPSLVITGAISIKAWLFPRHPTFGSVVLSKTAGRPNRAGWDWEWRADGRLQFYVDGDGNYFNGIEREVETVVGAVPSNAWTHVVTTFDPATQAMKIFANGVEAATTVTIGGTVNSIFPTTDPIRISGFQGSQSNPTLHFFGFVDEVGLYNRALTATEVGALFGAGSLGKCLPDAGGLPGAGEPEEPSAALRIGQFSFSGQPQGGLTGAREMTLRWTASPGQRFAVEQSEDLVQWRMAEAVVTEPSPGVYTAVLPISRIGSAFYRLRRN